MNIIKKKTLIISPGIPYPPINGHKLKLFHLLNQASNYLDIDLIIISNEELTLDAKEYLNTVCSSFKLFRFSKFSFILNLFKAVFNKKLPYQVAYYKFNTVSNYIKKSTFNYDVVMFNLIRTTGYFDLFEPRKIVLDLVDSIGISYLRSRKSTSSSWFRWIYKVEALRLINLEKSNIQKAKSTTFVNFQEASYFSKYGNVQWIPNGVNNALHSIRGNLTTYNNAVCFLGSMYYQPNIDAVCWFAENVVPKLKSDIKFYIIGSRPAKKVLKLQSEKIIVMGFVDEPFNILKSCLCTVAPMQTGGGIQNKVLESMALGQITIVNDLAANPIIGAIDKFNILIANSPHQFADIINDIGINKSAYKYIGDNAQALIKRNYTWELYGEKLSELLNHL